MANIYYFQPVDRHSVLRAVLSTEECTRVLDGHGHSARYVGQQFPVMGQDVKVGFAVLRIYQGEMSDERRAGFYRFDDGIMQIEEAIQACTSELVNVGHKQPKVLESKAIAYEAI
jgi:hypothetical protein